MTTTLDIAIKDFLEEPYAKAQCEADRDEAYDDAYALVALGHAIGAAIKAAGLGGRSNLAILETSHGYGTMVQPKAEDLIDGLCDQMGPGAEVVRAAAKEACK